MPRCITESWWRKIKISEVFHASSHRDSHSHVITLVIRRKTNRRHMISDHYGRSPTSQLRCSQPRMGFSARTGGCCTLLRIRVLCSACPGMRELAIFVGSVPETSFRIPREKREPS
jgi:hypothetical protein